MVPEERAKERKGQRHRGRIGLVLGAGGPVGHAFHAGVLRALEEVLGWDVRAADLVLGTSAGAQVAALLRAGLHGEDLASRVAGAPLDARAHEIARHYVRPSTDAPHPEHPRTFLPASLGFLARALLSPSLLRPGRVVAAMLPPGRVRLDPLSDGFFQLFGDRWPEALWLTSVSLDTGEPVVFGRDGAPAIDVGTAVAASAAVPGVFVPVAWRGTRYVDGGIASATHLGELASEKLDLVIVSSPLSVYAPMRSMLRREVRALETRTPVMTLEPTPAAAAAMGYQMMKTHRMVDVARVAYETTLRTLESGPLRERLSLVF